MPRTTDASVFQDAARQLREAASTYGTALVAYSCGKDSLCVMDMCRRAFDRVVGVYLYFVPGLRLIEEQLAWARQRWGVEIHQYPSYVFYECLREGIYCRVPQGKRALPGTGFKREEYWEVIKRDLGIDLLVTGQKESDFWQRRASLRQQQDGGRGGKKARKDGWLNPLRKWTKFDVLAYIKARDLPLPPTSGRQSTGVSLSTPSLLW